MRTKRKRMRLPNGFGRITELHSNLRNPYRVMVTVGTDKQGRPIGKLLKPQAYFATYNEAYTALIKYHENPADMAVTMTMEELYERWSAVHYLEVADSTRRQYMSAWKYCEKIKGLGVRDVKGRHIKACCEDENVPPNTRLLIKTLFTMLFAYAVENDWVDKNYAKEVSVSKTTHKRIAEKKVDHLTFTDEELVALWNNLYNIPSADMVLIQCYMGWRPSEMLGIELKNVDLGQKIIVGGIKTDAGINRTVPIHSLIYPLIADRYNRAMESNSRFLFNSSRRGIQMSYSKYNHIFKEVINGCKLRRDHRPHDPRKTFVTNAKKYNVDEYAIKRIVGHHIADITEKVYCDRDITWLRTEIEKIKKPSC